MVVKWKKLHLTLLLNAVSGFLPWIMCCWQPKTFSKQQPMIHFHMGFFWYVLQETLPSILKSWRDKWNNKTQPTSSHHSHGTTCIALSSDMHFFPFELCAKGNIIWWWAIALGITICYSGPLEREDNTVLKRSKEEAAVTLPSFVKESVEAMLQALSD